MIRKLKKSTLLNLDKMTKSSTFLIKYMVYRVPIVNRALPSLDGGSLEITLTVPFNNLKFIHYGKCNHYVRKRGMGGIFYLIDFLIFLIFNFKVFTWTNFQKLLVCQQQKYLYIYKFLDLSFLYSFVLLST